MVAAGGAAVAVMPDSEIMVAPGVDFAGSLAPEIQFMQIFSAAIVAGSAEIEAVQTVDRTVCFRARRRSHQKKRHGAAREVVLIGGRFYV
jgi:hypothetical protein